VNVQPGGFGVLATQTSWPRLDGIHGLSDRHVVRPGYPKALNAPPELSRLNPEMYYVPLLPRLDYH